MLGYLRPHRGKTFRAGTGHPHLRHLLLAVPFHRPLIDQHTSPWAT
ncbi:MAG: hypothetical protein R2851_18975 [Caldilineaceae bacterium]